MTLPTTGDLSLSAIYVELYGATSYPAGGVSLRDMAVDFSIGAVPDSLSEFYGLSSGPVTIPDNYTFGYTEGSTNINITIFPTTASWYSSVDQAFIFTSDNLTSDICIVYCDENLNVGSRSATVTIHHPNGNTATIDIQQIGAPSTKIKLGTVT